MEEITECAEILIKYSGYIQREREQAEKLERLEYVFIPEGLDYAEIQALSTEARQKLDRIRPRTIGQASRIPRYLAPRCERPARPLGALNAPAQWLRLV